MFAIVVAFVIPEVFSANMTAQETLNLSAAISIILIILYQATLYFKLFTHRGVYPTDQEGEFATHDEEPEWSKRKAIIILALAPLAVAYVSESLVHTFSVVGETFGWTELFIGVIIVAIVGMPRLLLWHIRIKWMLQLKLQLDLLYKLRCLLLLY